MKKMKNEKFWTIVVFAVTFILIVAAGFMAFSGIKKNAGTEATPGASQPGTQPGEQYTAEQVTAMQDAVIKCNQQCVLETQYARSFGATRGIVDGFPRTQSPWCSTVFNIRNRVENCYMIGAECFVFDANNDTCKLKCVETVAKCI